MALAPTDDLSQMLERAIGLHQRGRLADAEKLYRNVLRARPKHFEARHLLGILRFQQGRADEALDLIAAALEAKPDYPEALYNRGNILAELERYEEALASYDAALALAARLDRRRTTIAAMRCSSCGATRRRWRPTSARWRSSRITSRRSTAAAPCSRTSSATTRRWRATTARWRCAPDSADALYNRGNLLKELKRFEESLASYAKARAHRAAIIPIAFGIIDPALAVCDWAHSDALAEALRADLDGGQAERHAVHAGRLLRRSGAASAMREEFHRRPDSGASGSRCGAGRAIGMSGSASPISRRTFASMPPPT